jgi:predicted metal-binding membrane protein
MVRPDRRSRFIPVGLVAVAALGWWWSIRMADDMTAESAGMSSMAGMPGMSMGPVHEHSLSLGAFMVGWLAMMAAMMLPAVSPVVRLYARAARTRTAAPVPFFVAGYLVVWTSLGLPAYFAWRALMEPIADAEPWAARLAGGVLIAAAVWQLTPLKSVCLRHCRSPLSFFLGLRGSLARPAKALRAGASHGLYCVGCCWALMAVLVALGTMNLGWMLALAVLILLEKNAPWGERVATGAAVLFVLVAIVLIVNPPALNTLT